MSTISSTNKTNLLVKSILMCSLFIHFIVNNSSAQSHKTPRFLTDSLDAYIKKGMAEWRIPGLAIAIIQDGKVIVSKGYGVRKLGTPEPVDENTLFYIASNSKLFTASALAKLEQEKQLSLDTNVITYLPDFQLYDPVATKMVTVRDLLSNRLGLKPYQGDFLWWDSDFTAEDIMHTLKKFKPQGQFRQDYGYSNAAFTTAGLIIPKVTPNSWSEYIQKEFLKPLGMTRSKAVTAGFKNESNIAYPYSTCCNAEGALIEVPFDNLDNIGPAGGMVSSVHDMARWLQMHLDSGRYEGKQILPWKAIETIRKPNTIISYQKHPIAPFTYQFYCLGIGLVDYANLDVYSHTGGAFGYHSNVTIIPSQNVGIIILTNQDFNNFYEALRFQIIEAYGNLPYVNRDDYFWKRAQQRDQKHRQELLSMQERVKKNVLPPIPLKNYTGTYHNDLYGAVTISLQGPPTHPSLTVHFQHHPTLTATLVYMDHDTFELSFSNPRFGKAPALFTIKDGIGSAIDIKATDFVDYDAYHFQRN